MRIRLSLAFAWIVSIAMYAAQADEAAFQRWIERFSFKPPAVESSGICQGTIGALPSFDAVPDGPGKRLVRVSLPFAPGALPAELGLNVKCESKIIVPDLRVLTLHPGKPASVRRAIITFPFDFEKEGRQHFHLALAPQSDRKTDTIKQVNEGLWRLELGGLAVTFQADMVGISGARGDWSASLIAPKRKEPATPKIETIESGANYLWVRLLEPDSEWPRILEVKMDGAGSIEVWAHVQRLAEGDATAPDLGWRIDGPVPQNDAEYLFSTRSPVVISSKDAMLTFPFAHLYERGYVKTPPIEFLRCTSDELVPFQESAWRSAGFLLTDPLQFDAKNAGKPATYVHASIVAQASCLQPLESMNSQNAGRMPALQCLPYVFSQDLKLYPVLNQLSNYTDDAIVKSALRGDDFGNVTAFSGTDQAPAFGMNRLNHCAAIFDEARRTGNRALLDTAIQWCVNMYDLSLWWADKEGFGGTRYNNAQAGNSKAHAGERNYMWRENNAVHFCTKGFDSFFMAYEETGDPRMATALAAQVAYAQKYVHTDQGECRNVGDADDFMRMYRYTGVAMYRDEAMRLFRELREKLSSGDLFSQGGQPIVEDGPFVDDDDHGYKAPFAKPYIIGYALAGLPDLLRDFPDEPKLRDVIRAVADFLAASQDPAGGWRYPHPKSSRIILDQSMEHAGQLSRAAAVLEQRGEPIDKLLDAIERVLQARVNVFARSGKILSGLQGWEFNSGNLKEGQTIYDLYKKPADRDPARDYTEGVIGLGSSSPEGIVYFPEVLAFYLAHRPAERLFHADDHLASLLKRIEEKPVEVAPAAMGEPLGYGVRLEIPAFRDARVLRMNFPLAWANAGLPFAEWREKARAAYLNCLLVRPPLAPFAPQVIATEDRGTYEARKIVLSLSADTRVAAYLLVPKGKGPFPAILALHDHGAHFSIGKEKVIRPFGVSDERMKDAEKWVDECYGGKFIGDELAQRGYVVFSTDALFWGDRGRQEGIKHSAQETLAANMFQLGMSWAGNIVWDDIRSAEFVQGLPEVDPDRIGCTGLSMGSHRTWSLVAATDIVKAGAAICWMCDTPTLTSDHNNQTTGQSAFSMLLPNIRNLLDYPDVASIACPKPMLFFNGEKDGLFPVEGVQASYEKLHRVWRDQNADDKLVTKLWPVPHVFNREMQAEAFAWLDDQLKKDQSAK